MYNVRQYGNDFADRLRSSGFKVEVATYFKEFSEKDKKKFGFPEEVIYIGTKESV